MNMRRLLGFLVASTIYIGVSIIIWLSLGKTYIVTFFLFSTLGDIISGFIIKDLCSERLPSLIKNTFGGGDYSISKVGLFFSFILTNIVILFLASVFLFFPTLLVIFKSKESHANFMAFFIFTINFLSCFLQDSIVPYTKWVAIKGETIIIGTGRIFPKIIKSFSSKSLTSVGQLGLFHIFYNTRLILVNGESICLRVNSEMQHALRNLVANK